MVVPPVLGEAGHEAEAEEEQGPAVSLAEPQGWGMDPDAAAEYVVHPKPQT